MQLPPADTPIVCDLSTAADTADERLAEYQRLFAQTLIGRERVGEGRVLFQFRAEKGVEAWVRDLAAREHACCGFMAFDVTTVDGEVRMEVGVSDNDAARAVLEEYYLLPDLVAEAPAVLADRYRGRGLQFINGDT